MTILPIIELRKNETYTNVIIIYSNLLIRNFLRLCESKYPALTGRRVVAEAYDLRVNLERHDFPVQFNLSPMLTLMSKELLKPINSSIDVTRTVQQPNIFPFNSVINFDDKNVYENGDFMGKHAI